MATKDNIISLPNSHLRTKSQRVGLITPQVKKIIEDMKAATLDWEDSRRHELGVALAAIQIDKAFRIIIIRNDFDNKKDRGFQILINPEIVKKDGDIVEDYEGCLSIKDIYGKVPRYNRVRVKALNEHGKSVRLKAEGFLARVIQHEVDHTQGVVFIDYIKDDPEAFFRLDEEGKLNPLDYEKDVRQNNLLW